LGQERRESFGVARREATPPFELFECVFDQVPVAIQCRIQGAGVFAVYARWHLDLHALRSRLAHDRIAVVPLVRDQMLGFEVTDQFISFCTIRSGTLRCKDSERHTMRIHGQMELGVEPPFVRPMPSLPPGAPAALACALQ